MDIYHSQVRKFNSHDSIIKILEISESTCEVMYKYPDGLQIVGNLIHILESTHEVDQSIFEMESVI